MTQIKQMNDDNDSQSPDSIVIKNDTSSEDDNQLEQSKVAPLLSPLEPIAAEMNTNIYETPRTLSSGYSLSDNDRDDADEEYEDDSNNNTDDSYDDQPEGFLDESKLEMEINNVTTPYSPAEKVC